VEANDKHDAEIDDSRVSAEVDIEKNNESILLHVDSKATFSSVCFIVFELLQGF